MIHKVLITSVLLSVSLFAEADKFNSLIEQLGAESFRERKAAEKSLWEAAPASVEYLKKAAKSDDPEVAYRAKRVLDKISKGIFPGLSKELQSLIEEFWKKKDEEKSSFLVSLYNFQGQKSFKLIKKLLELAKANGKAVSIKALFKQERFRKTLIDSDNKDVIYSLFRFYAEEGFSADFIYLATHYEKLNEELIYYEKKFKENKTLDIEMLYMALCRATGKHKKVTELSESMSRESNPARLSALETNDIPLLTEFKNKRSLLTTETSKLFVKKYLQNNNPTKNKIQDLIDKFEQNEPKKLIEALMLLDEKELALQVAEKYIPEDAITYHSKAGDVKKAIEVYQQNSNSLAAKLAISHVYLNYFEHDKIKEVLSHDILDQVKPGQLIDFLLPYSYTLEENDLINKLDQLLTESNNNSYTIKRLLSNRYKVSAHYIWNFLGNSDNMRLQNFYRLIKKQFSKEELQKLLADAKLKVDTNSNMAYALAVICQKYDLHKEANNFLNLTYRSGHPQFSEIIRLIKKQKWQISLEKLSKASFNKYYKQRAQFLTAACMKKLDLNGYNKVMLEALVGKQQSIHNRINFLQDLITAGLKEESRFYAQAVFANFYLEKSSHFYKNAFSLMAEYEHLHGNSKSAFEKQIISTAISIQNDNLQKPIYVLRFLSQLYSSQLKLGISTQDKDLVKNATQKYLTYYISDSEFSERAINFLDQHNQINEADKLHKFSDKKFAEMTKVFPKSATLYNNKSWNSALCSRNLEQAESEVKKALELESDNAHYWDTLAEVYLRQGKLQDCLKMADKALAISLGSVSFKERHQDFIDRVEAKEAN